MALSQGENLTFLRLWPLNLFIRAKPQMRPQASGHRQNEQGSKEKAGLPLQDPEPSLHTQRCNCQPAKLCLGFFPEGEIFCKF